MAEAILYDSTKCTACRACQVACKQWNELEAEETTNRGTYENPPELSASTWNKIKFTELELNGEFKWIFTRLACMHCEEASCQNVCPTGAISKTDEGFVLIDQKWCIGCGYCVQACPYEVPHKDEHTGTARKCTSCADRTSNDLKPACVTTCPTGALTYGDRSSLLSDAEQRVAALGGSATLYGENELGGLHALYILEDSPEVYGLPAEPQVATKNSIGQWLSGLITAGLITALPFWFIFRRKDQIAVGDANEGGAK
ncbi:MAG TPA: 4Fe-4S dicluster domain-containing protein [Dehalococcoidia bacterium]|nr:4Fe-4S dicluster domain-containing protein [Dehalococcoidia bacterium]